MNWDETEGQVDPAGMQVAKTKVSKKAYECVARSWVELNLPIGDAPGHVMKVTDRESAEI